MADTTARPKRYAPWYNISLANQPINAWVSIFHRVSGAVLFLLLFLTLHLLGRSLESPESFAYTRDLLDNWFVKLVMLGLIWAYMHHFFAGIRYLLLDLHQGIDLAGARRSSTIVFVVSLAFTVVLGAMLLW